MTRLPATRACLVILLALQAVVIAPVALALATPAALMSAADCDPGTDSATQRDDCCTPDGSAQGDCTAACIGVAAAVPSITQLPWLPIEMLGSVRASSLLPSLHYSPVNPPPIG